MFAHRLALALSMPRDRMIARMSAREFADWMAFFRLEGFEADADRRHAENMALHANINRNTKKHPKPYAAADFLPRRKPEPLRQKIESKMRAYQALRGQLNG